jgi:hypothetical protein
VLLTPTNSLLVFHMGMMHPSYQDDRISFLDDVYGTALLVKDEILVCILYLPPFALLLLSNPYLQPEAYNSDDYLKMNAATAPFKVGSFITPMFLEQDLQKMRHSTIPPHGIRNVSTLPTLDRFQSPWTTLLRAV